MAAVVRDVADKILERVWHGAETSLASMWTFRESGCWTSASSSVDTSCVKLPDKKSLTKARCAGLQHTAGVKTPTRSLPSGRPVFRIASRTSVTCCLSSDVKEITVGMTGRKGGNGRVKQLVQHNLRVRRAAATLTAAQRLYIVRRLLVCPDRHVGRQHRQIGPCCYLLLPPT